MTNRTVQFWGQGYSSAASDTLTPCEITATVDGNIVFSGGISTVQSAIVNRQPNDQQILFSFEIPMITGNASYTLPVSLEITGDIVYLESVTINYCPVGNTTSGPTGFQNVSTSDARSNVVISNAVYSNPPPVDPRPAGQEGTWGWEIKTAPGTPATMSFDLTVLPGTA